MSKNKRKFSVAFDPVQLKDKIKRRQTIIDTLTKLSEEFLSNVRALMTSSDDVESILMSSSQLVVELAVVSLLGLHRVESIRYAYHHVPNTYCDKRSKFIAPIISSVLSTNELQEDTTVCLASVVEVTTHVHYMYS